MVSLSQGQHSRWTDGKQDAPEFRVAQILGLLGSSRKEFLDRVKVADWQTMLIIYDVGTVRLVQQPSTAVDSHEILLREI